MSWRITWICFSKSGLILQNARDCSPFFLMPFGTHYLIFTLCCVLYVLWDLCSAQVLCRSQESLTVSSSDLELSDQADKPGTEVAYLPHHSLLFYLGSREWELGPHAYIIGTGPSRPSPLRFLKMLVQLQFFRTNTKNVFSWESFVHTSGAALVLLMVHFYPC